MYNLLIDGQETTKIESGTLQWDGQRALFFCIPISEDKTMILFGDFWFTIVNELGRSCVYVSWRWYSKRLRAAINFTSISLWCFINIVLVPCGISQVNNLSSAFCLLRAEAFRHSFIEVPLEIDHFHLGVIWGSSATLYIRVMENTFQTIPPLKTLTLSLLHLLFP